MADATFQVEFRGERFARAEDGLMALAKNFELAPNSAALALKAELHGFLTHLADVVSSRNSTAYPGGQTSTTLNLRSGLAARSIRQSVGVKGMDIAAIQGRIGGTSYLRPNERGATIRAKKKYLTIPLKDALNSNGTPKFKRARDWGGTFVLEHGGKLFICKKQGRKTLWLYRLKDEVVIPPRLGFENTIRQAMPEFSDTAPAAMVRRMVHDQFS